MLKMSNGHEYEVIFSGLAVSDDALMIRMSDHRRLPEIASEFDGIEWIRTEKEDQRIHEFVGYSKLSSISRMSDDSVLISLVKEVATDG